MPQWGNWQTRYTQDVVHLVRVGSSPTWGTMAIRTDILERKSDILKWVDDQEPKAEIAIRVSPTLQTFKQQEV